MKKIMISAALVCLAGFTYAQKPVAGDVTGDVELQFQTGTQAIHIESPKLNARYFLKDDMALRLTLTLGTSSSSDDFTENPDGTGGTGTAEFSNSSFGLGVGIQKHFAGTEKLSPFVGAGISFVTGSSSSSLNNVDDLGFGNQYVAGSATIIDGPSTSTFGIGVNAGADYYFVNHIYLGIEVALNFTSTSEGEKTTTTSSTGVPSTTSITQGGSSSGFGVSPNTGIRLGFVF